MLYERKLGISGSLEWWSCKESQRSEGWLEDGCLLKTSKVCRRCFCWVDEMGQKRLHCQPFKYHFKGLPGNQFEELPGSRASFPSYTNLAENCTPPRLFIS